MLYIYLYFIPLSTLCIYWSLLLDVNIDQTSHSVQSCYIFVNVYLNCSIYFINDEEIWYGMKKKDINKVIIPLTDESMSMLCRGNIQYIKLRWAFHHYKSMSMVLRDEDFKRKIKYKLINHSVHDINLSSTIEQFISFYSLLAKIFHCL